MRKLLTGLSLAAILTLPTPAFCDWISNSSLATGVVVVMVGSNACGPELLGVGSQEVTLSLNAVGASRQDNPQGMRSSDKKTAISSVTFLTYDSECNPSDIPLVALANVESKSVLLDGTIQESSGCFDMTTGNLEPAPCSASPARLTRNNNQFAGTFLLPDGRVVELDLNGHSTGRTGAIAYAHSNPAVVMLGVSIDSKFDWMRENIRKAGLEEDILGLIKQREVYTQEVSGSLRIDGVDVPIVSKDSVEDFANLVDLGDVSSADSSAQIHIRDPLPL